MSGIGMHIRAVVAVAMSILMVTSIVGAGVGFAGLAAGDESSDDVEVTTDGTYIESLWDVNRVDRDEDGHFSDFDIDVFADTDLDTGFSRTTDPYFNVVIDDTVVATKDVDAASDWYLLEIEQADLESLDLDRGYQDITVELRNSQIGDDPIYDEESILIRYESADQDLSERQRGLIGINSLDDPYATASDYLSFDYWQNRQLNSVVSAFEELFPTPPDDINDLQYEATKSLLDEVAFDGFADTLTTVPAVADDVSGSLEEGKLANTLVKTSDSTRSNFHTSLDDLKDNTASLDDDPSDAELETRLALIEETYERSVKYESEVQNSYTDNQEFFPDIIIWLYGADEDSFDTIQGFFEQLQQELIADYYYTQLARHPNQTPTNLETTVGDATPEYPTAEVVDISTPSTVQTGDEVTVSMTVQTNNAETPSQTMTLGFPDDDQVTDVDLESHDISSPQYATAYPTGSSLWTRYGEREESIPYPVVEAATDMDDGETHTIEATLTPTEAGELRVWGKSIAWADTEQGSLNPDPGWSDADDSDVVEDGQHEYAYERTITVEDPDPAEFDVAIDDTNGPVVEGEDLEVEVTIKNTGEISDSQSVAVEIDGLGSDTEWVDLNGETETSETFDISTQTGDAGSYSATVESDDDTASTSVTVEPQLAELAVTSTPDGADVYLDGDRVGTTPFSEEHPVTESYDIEVQKDDYLSETEANVSPGSSVDFDLEPETATIDVSSDPSGGDVYVDDTFIDTTDADGISIERPVTDSYDVRVEFDEYETETFSDVTPPVSLEATPEADTAELSIDSTPDGADVYLDGERVGTTPYTAEHPITDSYDIELQKAGYEPATRSDIAPPEELDIELTEIADGPFVDVAIVDTDAPVVVGDSLNATIDIENTGDIAADQELDLTLEGHDSKTERVELEGEARTTVTMELDTDATAEPGEHPLAVASENATDTTTVTIREDTAGPFVEVDLVETNAPVTPGEPLNATVAVENTGDELASQPVNLTAVEMTDAMDETTVEAAPGETTEVSLSLPTDGVLPAEYTLSTASLNTTDTTTVTIQNETAGPFFEIEIMETNTPVSAGEMLEIETVVTNEGAAGETVVELVTDETNETLFETSVELEGDVEEVTTVPIRVPYEELPTGETTFEVRPADDTMGTSDSVMVDIEADSIPVTGERTLDSETAAPGETVAVEVEAEAQTVTDDMIFLEELDPAVADTSIDEIHREETTLDPFDSIASEDRVDATVFAGLEEGETMTLRYLVDIPADADPGAEYTIDGNLTTGDETVGIDTTTITIEDDTGEHDSGVDQALFEAVDQDDTGELTREELRTAVEAFVRTGEIDGHAIERTDVRNLVQFFIRH